MPFNTSLPGQRERSHSISRHDSERSKFSLVPDAERLLDDPSPLIRGAAVWALSQLLPREAFVAMRRDDADAGVMEEWS